jgi:hypothetical protein
VNDRYEYLSDTQLPAVLRGGDISMLSSVGHRIEIFKYVEPLSIKRALKLRVLLLVVLGLHSGCTRGLSAYGEQFMFAKSSTELVL